MEDVLEPYCRMEMDGESRTSRTGRVRGKLSLIFSVSAAVVVFILLVMTFVTFGYQERRFAGMESFMISHDSSLNSVNSELKLKLQNTGSDLEKMLSEVGKSVSSLSSYVDSYNSRLQDQFSSGAQVKKLTDLQTLINNLGSSLGSISSKLETQQQETGQQSSQYSELKTLLNSINNTVSDLSAKLQHNVKQQDLGVVKDSLAALNFSLASFKSEQLKRNQDSGQRMMDTLNEIKAKLESINDPTELLNRMMTEITKLSTSIESLSTKLQSTDQRVMAALAEMKAKLENKNVTTVSSCKSGWTSFGSRCYFFSSDQLNWHQARDYCRSQNSFLLTVESDEELAFIKTRITAFHWVGLTDEVTGQWRWDDGTPYIMNKDQWVPGQPDDWKDHGLGEEGEDCGHLKPGGKLNDVHCSTRMRYICSTSTNH
ncbi:C-type lectin domain family 10 member A-like isoform X2 [Astyanax mexicanus]|uniref:C-type lectin domain family 10 member A-like isoform X2 n=1 Tax=Astyanax mexicanus TaxID=7994 RepID=UPI0020CAD469|nr:C-type lectin domain family 10 member A-like isoform X2 [Astyanax mexicanus]